MLRIEHPHDWGRLANYLESPDFAAMPEDQQNRFLALLVELYDQDHPGSEEVSLMRDLLAGLERTATQ